MKELRDYQTKNSELGAKILKDLGIVYFAMQVRTGKTATALKASSNKAKNTVRL